jgi:hypothetical protein
LEVPLRSDHTEPRMADKFNEAALKLAMKSGRQAALALPGLFELGAGGMVTLAGLAFMGMPGEGVQARRTLSDTPVVNRQALAEEMAVKIMALPSWQGVADDTKELVAQGIRDMHRKALVLHEAADVKVEDVAETITTVELLAEFFDLWNFELLRGDRVLEALMKRIIKVVRVDHTVGYEKETSIRRCQSYEQKTTSGGAWKAIELRPMRLDVETQSLIAGEAEVSEDTTTDLAEVLRLMERWVWAHLVAAGKTEVRDDMVTLGRGKHGDKVLMFHYTEARNFIAAYNKLAQLEKDANKIMVHMMGSVDLLRRYTAEIKPPLSLSAAFFEVGAE